MPQVRLHALTGRLYLPLALACLAIPATVNVAMADTFDGVYRGGQHTTLSNNSGACARIDTNNAVIRVQNNHFTRRWGLANFSVDVATDGSFEAQQIVGTGHSSGTPRVAQIKGQITNGNLEADVGASYCGAHLSLKKS